LATPEGTWALLSRWITPEDATLWRQATYRFHALVADNWQADCVFVAGDAAHQQPPFLGQGMCQGIRDVTNLSWKLGAVLRGEASRALLETYGVERKMHVTELTTRIKAIDVAKARARDAHLLAECGGVVKSMPRQNVQPALAVGLLSPQLHPARGTIFPQPWIRQGDAQTRLDALAGMGWRVVVSAGANAALLHGAVSARSPLMQVVDMATPNFQEADGVLANWFSQNECAAAIVRPDHYVYGVASSAQALVTQLDSLRSAYLAK
jgi:3-(3-hydroxy-phenyl)propionate hydroxylase